MRSLNTSPVTALLARVFESRFAHRSEAVVKRVAGHKVMQEILDEAEAETVAYRARLVEQLAALPAKHEARLRELGEKSARAHERYLAACAAVAEAQKEHNRLSGETYGAQHAAASESGEIIRQLQETADPRIAQFADECHMLANAVRHSLIVPELREPTNAALQACLAAREAAHALRLQALHEGEVTSRLQELAQGIEKLLAPLLAFNDFEGLQAPKVPTLSTTSGDTVAVH